MRKIFMTKKSDFIASVKDFELGRIPPKLDKGDPGYDLLHFVQVENYAGKRKAASGETDFAQMLILDILPALHCHFLLSESKKYIDINKAFVTNEHKDNLMWLLLFMVQTVRRHGMQWRANALPPRKQAISNRYSLLGMKR